MSSFQSIRPRSSNVTEDDAVRSPSQPAESSVSVGKGRKRKAPAHVSQNACTNCKRARAKCDGMEGQPCTRCNSRSLKDSCQYELHIKTAKEELVRKIRDLEGANEQLQTDVKEKDAWIRTMTEMFAPGTTGSTFLQQLRAEGSSYHALISALSAPPQVTRFPESSTGFRGSDSDEMMESDDEAPSRWTSVTQDDQRIHHLMALYFAWIHPVHMFFSERHFIDSFKARNRTYCSPALVNAICALGSRYCIARGGNEVAITRLGDRFTQQVWADLRAEKSMTPVSLVVYAIMFLVQVSAGQARDAFSHLRLAVDSLADIDRDGWSDEAFQVTFFGIQTVNINWSALTYQKPPAPITSHMPVFDNVDLDRSGSSWTDYKVERDASKTGTIAARAIETAKETARLALINLESVTSWCGITGKITTKTILDLYQRYLSWKQKLSEALDDKSFNAENGEEDETLPYVLLLHINYSVSICQLFNPLLECRGLSKQAKLHIQGITVRSAQEGLNVYERFTKLFSNRYQSPLQAFYLVHLADVVVRQDRQHAEKVIRFCLEQLGQALPGFPVVGPLQAMFCDSVISCNQPLPKDVVVLMGGRTWQSYSREDRLGCCERLTYAQPVDKLAKSIDESLPETFKEEWDQFIESYGREELDELEARRLSNASGSGTAERHSSHQRSLDINSLVNP